MAGPISGGSGPLRLTHSARNARCLKERHVRERSASSSTHHGGAKKRGAKIRTGATSGELHIPPLHPVEVVLVPRLHELVPLLHHTIPMRQLATQQVAEDLGVAMRVRGEAGAARDAVLVEHAQRAEGHVALVIVVGKAEGVIGVQPAVVGVAARAAAAGHDLGVGERLGHCRCGGFGAHGRLAVLWGGAGDRRRWLTVCVGRHGSEELQERGAEDDGEGSDEGGGDEEEQLHRPCEGGREKLYL